jgi:hypothetical protein
LQGSAKANANAKEKRLRSNKRRDILRFGLTKVGVQAIMMISIPHQKEKGNPGC